MALGGSVGLNKRTSGTVSLTKICPAGITRFPAARSTSTALSQTIGTFQITAGAVNGTGTFTSNADYDLQAGTVGVVLAGEARPT